MKKRAAVFRAILCAQDSHSHGARDVARRQVFATADAIGYCRVMPKRVAAILFLVLVGLSLGGCSRCGWLWDQGPRSCHSDSPPK